MDYASMDDQQLVATLSPGDEDGWTELFRRYRRLIWWHIHKAGVRAQDRDDPYQDIQLAIYDGILHRYDGKGTVKAYINGISKNCLLQYWRHHPRGAQDDGDSAEDRALQIPDPAAESDASSLEHEAAERVRGVLESLKPKERKMLILRYKGRSHAEICKRLKIRSEGASRRYLSKVTDKVAQICERRNIDPDEFRTGMQTLDLRGELDEMLRC